VAQVAPPAETTFAPAARAVEPAGSLTIAAVQHCFDQALEDLEEGRTKDGRRGTLIAKALRNAAQLLKVSGHEIHFITSAMMKEKFEKPQPRANIDDVFSRLLGQTVNVRFWSDTEVSISAGSGPAAGPSGSDKQGLDETTTALIRIATEELGGKIVDKFEEAHDG
jgi:hypothetical protein